MSRRERSFDRFPGDDAATCLRRPLLSFRTTCDANGNQLTIEEPTGEVTTNVWDGENRLVAVEHPDFTVTSYAYNADGLKVEKDDGVAVTRFLYDGNNLLRELDDLGTVEAEFTYVPQPYAHLVSQNRDGDSSFYHFDGTRNTAALSDSAGVTTDEYSFDAWGKLRSSTGSTSNAHTYKGELLAYHGDPDAGPEESTYSLHHRDYVAQQGRFRSEDQAESRPNRYTYCSNDPINRSDPGGLADRRLVEDRKSAGELFQEDLAGLVRYSLLNPGFLENVSTDLQALPSLPGRAWDWTANTWEHTDQLSLPNRVYTILGGGLGNTFGVGRIADAVEGRTEDSTRLTDGARLYQTLTGPIEVGSNVVGATATKKVVDIVRKGNKAPTPPLAAAADDVVDVSTPRAPQPEADNVATTHGNSDQNLNIATFTIDERPFSAGSARNPIVGNANTRLQRVNTGGARNDLPLTKVQLGNARAVALEYGASDDMLRFSDTMNTSYGNLFGKEVLYISNDVLPAANPSLGGMAANSRLTMRASLAHELYGHRVVVLAGKSRVVDGQISRFANALEEAEASIRAARFAPNLSSMERVTLLRDGIARLRSEGIRISEVRERLWITQP